MHASEPAGTGQRRHFEAEIIILCVRWYLRFGLSFRNLEEMMAERNLAVDHVTIWRWVRRLRTRTPPPLPPRTADDESLLAGPRNLSSRRGKWTYLYRAVDPTAATINFLLSAKRDAAAAKRLFQKAWYFRFGLSFRNLEEMMAERNLAVDHVTNLALGTAFTHLTSTAAATQNCG